MSKKILLADDSITIQKVIELTFSDEDFDVITVGNGRLALEKLPEVRPDIVLCDIIMPEKDGYEVCEQIKTNPATSHVPVLLLTGAFEPFDQERAARAGYDGSLAKPFEPETLIAKVKDLLGRAPARAVAPPPAPRPAPEAPPAAPPAPRAQVAPPPILPFPRPAPPAPAPPPRPPSSPSFIPEEPFGTLDESAFAGGAGHRPEGSAAEAFAPITAEEAATLSAPPAEEKRSSADAASTVMFRAGDLPWNAPPTAPPVVPPPPAAAAGPEPMFVPEPAEVPGAMEQPSIFEEVLEEDLDFGATSFEPEAQPGPAAADAGATVMLTPGPGAATMPPLPSADDASTGAFAAVVAPAAPNAPEEGLSFGEATFPEPELEPEPEAAAPEPAPVATFRPRPAFVPPVPPSPAPSRPPQPVVLPGAVAPAVPEPTAPPQARPPLGPPPPTPVAPESFADVAAGVAGPAPPPSEAAALSVPVEMVEKIAQRVVAQISEKAVREIAWEVIPDLAEALIKREIERLKAELQKT